MRGWKTIETRTHERFAGLNKSTILIHAGMEVDGSTLVTQNPYLTRSQVVQDPDEVVSGYILGSAFVWNFRGLRESDSPQALIDCADINRFGLFLRDVKKFDEPIRQRGDRGIWYFDLKKMEKVRKPTMSPYQAKLW